MHVGGGRWTATRESADTALASTSSNAAAATAGPVGVSADIPFNDQGQVLMYWLDACEENNSIYLFGKVRSGCSTAVVVFVCAAIALACN